MVRSMVATRSITLDVRLMPPWERYARILRELEDLPPGETMVLLLDYEPRPLQYQLTKEHKGQYEICWLERVPGEWVVSIRKR